MTTKLEDVLAEEWEHAPGLATVTSGIETVAAFKPGLQMVPWARTPEDERRGARHVTRAAVAVLGKRALALVLKHEWHNGYTGGTDDAGFFNESTWCLECGGEPPTGHKPGCTWGAICDEARSLG